jgi:DNA-damage-inducible protein J
MLTTDVRCRIDAKTKAEAAEVIEAMGLNISDAIRMFLKAGCDGWGNSI